MARRDRKESSTVQPALEKFDVGVIVARFQVHRLTEAHQELIRHVCSEHEKVIVVLGIAPLPVSTNNPLDFESRKQMILEQFPDVTVAYVEDAGNDTVWSRRLDKVIRTMLTPIQSAVIYGGRDSFISHYDGAFSTRELTQTTFLSGTAERKNIARSRTRASADFRAGVIWASQSRFPTVFTTVDIALVDGDKILLGRKPDETLYRFIGGFSDPRSETYEQDARRECREEAGVVPEEVTYIGSANIDDWRYRNEPDKIRTMMFVGTGFHGRPTPGDDIEEVRYFNMGDLREADVVPNHRPLLTMLRDYLTKGA